MILGIEPDMDMNTEEELPEQGKKLLRAYEPSTKAKTEPVKTDLKAVFLTKLKGPDCATKADKDKLIALAVQRHEEGKLSKDDLTEIKLSA
jgi:hypothetical protein